MRKALLLCAAVALVGCAGGEGTPAADSPAAAVMPAPVTLADFAGSWTVQSMGEMSDSVLVTYELTATGDPAGWMMTFPGRDPIPMRVSVDGDSVMADVGPFSSVLRPGVQVTTQSVNRLQDGMLVGTFVAHYAGAGADSVLRGRTHGTKKP